MKLNIKNYTRKIGDSHHIRLVSIKRQYLERPKPASAGSSYNTVMIEFGSLMAVSSRWISHFDILDIG